MRYDAHLHREYSSRGFTHVVVTRTNDAGWLQAGVFLVALWCLGVKDAFFTEMTAHDWPETLDRVIPPEDRVAIHPACARKLVEGAVAYAEALGISPHHDYKKARRALGTISANDCPETFTYGKDGKPLYIAGPNDNNERIERIMRALTAKLGRDGFHYILPADVGSGELSAGDSLRELLWDRPVGTTSFEALSGFLTALEICPTRIALPQIREEVWGGEPPLFAGVRDQLVAEKCIAAHREEIAARLAAAQDTADPARAVDFDPEADPETDGAAEWRRGFLRPLALWPDAWGGAESRPELRGHFSFLRAVAADRDNDPTAGDIPFSIGELPAEIGRSVLALRQALQPPTSGSPLGRVG